MRVTSVLIFINMDILIFFDIFHILNLVFFLFLPPAKFDQTVSSLAPRAMLLMPIVPFYTQVLHVPKY